MLAKEILKLLHNTNSEYSIIQHAPSTSLVQAALNAKIDLAKIAVTTLVRDSKGPLMLVYPANTQLDLDNLNKKLDRQFSLIPNDDVSMEWPTYYLGQCAPISKFYKIPAEIHVSFIYSKYVYFAISDHEFCRVLGEQFSKLQLHAMYDDFFVTFADNQSTSSAQSQSSNTTDSSVHAPSASSSENIDRKQKIRDRLNNITTLPAMPTIAQKILELSVNPNANARNLTSIIEQDPSLSAQIIRYASSPLYGYKGELDSIQDVITRVLGYNLVLDMALGVAVGKMFKNPKEGRLGLNQFWRHATYCASLCQKLAEILNSKNKPKPGMTYLTGLLHNFGVLLLGHYFPTDFNILNKAATKYPNDSIIELEHTLIGATHMELGVWLMQAWNMPDEIIISIREHHNEHYHGLDSVYPNLIRLANHMLAEVEIGDELNTEIPDSLLQSLDIDRERVKEVFERLMGNEAGLDQMAGQMAA